MNLRKSDIVITLVFIAFLAVGNISGAGAAAQAHEQGQGSWYASAASALQQRYQATLDAIAQQFGFANLTSFTIGSYTYNHSETGLNAQYTDPQGNTLTIELCVNGAYYATQVTACQSAPNACGMTGTGFITRVISHERQLQSSTSACSAKIPPDNLCAGSCSPTTICSGGDLVDSCTGAVVKKCAYGCSAATNQCTPTQTQCISSHICNAASTAVIDSCDGSLIDDCAARGAVCFDGACKAQNLYFQSFDAQDATGTVTFSATGHLQARPILVNRGQPTRLYWDVLHAQSCTVSSQNGDSWTATASGPAGEQSSPITRQTIFTLSCQGYPGANPQSIQESATVNVTPTYNVQ